MAARLRVYFDTSVISALFDDRDPGRRDLTRTFWSELQRFDPCASPLVLREIGATPDADKRHLMLAQVEPLRLVAWRDEMATLAQAYLQQGVFPPAMRADAEHVAVAVVDQIPILVSWNFRHLVNRGRRIQVNLVNAQLGYEQIEIIAPPELL